MLNKLLVALTRKKTSNIEENDSKLARVLNLADLSFIGLGTVLGLGTFVLAGKVSKEEAGPAVCVSFLIAAIAAALAGLCYAEFAARVPKAGSAYVYSYVTVGEFVAFIVGWNLLLEYVIGTAGVARALSDYVDAMVNKAISRPLTELLPLNSNFLSKYPDFLSLAFMVTITVIVSVGVKKSSILNSVLTFLNIVTVLVVIIGGCFKADIDNWTISKESIPANITGGEGGFAPFGLTGIIKGSATCFFAFVGFDAVATAADEVVNPKRNIPLAIGICVFVSFLCYFGVSTVLTLMLPYYEQSVQAPFIHVFEQVDYTVVKWVATVGGIFAMASTLLSNMFALPRIFHAMATDGLLFKPLAKVSERTKAPLVATVFSGLFAGLTAVIFDTDQLVNMLSIGTLLAYLMVAVCVLILRYKHDRSEYYGELEFTKSEGVVMSTFGTFKRLFNLNGNKYPNANTMSIANWNLGIFICLSIVTCLFYENNLVTVEKPYTFGICMFMVVWLVICVVIMSRQPTHDSNLAFKVPCVPLLPCLSIFINLVLMVTRDYVSWIRLAGWLLIGLLIYFAYGIRHSNERKTPEKPTPAPAVNGSDAIRNKETYKEVTKF